MAMQEDVLYMIFLDLYREYDALDRYRCLDIMEGYIVGTRACRSYWYRMKMVALENCSWVLGG